ncbi:hypothetical protein [Bradyrhizobium ottawaense]|uniref:Uncharacterized protein n=1 Tax=Bradyrhizobium ottawaense TaxID=931866 RepID=A0ABY0QHJ4_9BRAD|nr:hypothetical protein [Bradyrhizobium ottawaense]SDK38622.1 hypothetical protein SAMN05444163_7989 [Bradyrhizobium ottawaense]SDK46631.1 hypothetical protein SAMN05444163_8182 [Bradyrhizobium ottawaense]
MNFKKLMIMAAITAVPSIALAVDSKTPELDKVTMAMKEALWKKGLSTSPTSINIAAQFSLLNELCGRTYMEDEVPFQLKMASVEAPAPVIQAYYDVFKRKMRESLMANPTEAAAFCK